MDPIGVSAVIPQELIFDRSRSLLTVTEPKGASPNPLRIGRNQVGLGIVDELKLVLHISQKEVGLPEATIFFFGEDAGSTQFFERLQGVSLPDRSACRSEVKLKRLNKKFDLPNPPPPQFNVARRLL